MSDYKTDPNARPNYGFPVDEKTLAIWPKRSREKYADFFGRPVPEELLHRINQRFVIQRMVESGNGTKPLGIEIRAMLDHREELLRRFLGLSLAATDVQVLDALKAALFEGFTVVLGDPSPERWGEVIQVAALLALDPDAEPSIRAACITVQDRLKARGVHRSYDTIRKDFYGNGGKHVGAKTMPLIHSGILAPLYAYGHANPRTVTVTHIRDLGEGGIGVNLSGILFFALRGNLDDTSGFHLSREQFADIKGERDAGADLVLIESKDSPTGLFDILGSVGFSVTHFYNDGPFANVAVPTIFVLREDTPHAVLMAVNDFLAARVARGEVSDFDPLTGGQ